MISDESCHSFESDACEDKYMVIMLPEIKKLKLYVFDIVAVRLNLFFFFSENFTTLDVWKCKPTTSSKAQSMVCIVTMRIRECETNNCKRGDEISYEIIFREFFIVYKALQAFVQGTMSHPENGDIFAFFVFFKQFGLVILYVWVF
ncbi:hypothetical protein CXB51_029656 [Gossypium anomalum]|uniref:Uncharacterized protein n=1 Tax=Gossypium anomalum TaxID=47600 RepID=A0A8J5Z174_9ROSI|nr:hypothetical protein CXB51_029656 [Gossypium anomalum]